MLRARKKDVRIKPNRKLDKRSSRGMLYENEELRLRTIEINAEVERGQLDIKKLRRENDHLRREMWALRDEYERLEKLIKHLDLAGTGTEHQQRNQRHSDGEDRADDDRRSPSLNGCGSDSGGASDGEDGPDRSAASEGHPRSGRAAVAEPRASVSNPDLGTCHCHESASYGECGNPDMDNIENYQKAYGRMPRSKVFVSTQHFEASTPSVGTGYETLTKARYSSASMEDEDGYAACSHPPVRVEYAQAPLMPPPPTPVAAPLLRPSLLRDPVVVVEEELVEVPDESASSGVDAEDEPAKAPPDTPSEDGHFNLDHLVNVVRSFQQDMELHEKKEAPAAPDADEPHSDESSCGEMSATATIKRRPESKRHRSVAIIERPVSSGGSSQSASAFFSAKSSLEGANEQDTYAQPIRKAARQATAILRRNSSSSSASSPPQSPSGGSAAASTTIVFLNNNNEYSGGVRKTASSGSVAKVSSPTAGVATDAPEEPLSTPNNCLSVYPLPEGDASASLLRLHAVDPHTVSFDLKEHPTAARSSVTVQEVIDQLEQQLEPARCHVRGVRMLEGGVFFVSLDSARSLHYLMRHSFRLRGHRVRLTDISAQTWIVALSGVPQYISDATVSLLLAAFGTIVGDVERRLFRGLDTGERLVRFRLKGGAKLPKHITVGGCRIQVRRMSPAPKAQSTSAASPAFEPEFISTATIVPEANSAPIKDEDAYGATKSAKSNPKIGRSFEYRSQLKVDLRMSAEVPVPPDESPVVTALPTVRATPTPGEAQANRRQTPPPPPLPPGHRCRHHEPSVAAASAPPPVGAPPDGRTTRESPPKSRASVNFEESIANAARGSTASGAVRASSSGKTSSSSPANGILRKSVSGEDPALESGNDASNAATASGGGGGGGGGGGIGGGIGSDAGAKGKAKLGGAVKKTARSFSLVDTFRVNRERRKPAVRVETVLENANPDEGVRTVVVRRDSAESSSRSSRGSRKSNELPWCGCWGNGCL